MDAGYEPERVAELTRRTGEAIDALAALASSDPAAADAMRAIRLTRLNLADHWMPALVDIGRSEAMLTWRSSSAGWWSLAPLHALARTTALLARGGGPAAATIPGRRRAELLGELDLLERAALVARPGDEQAADTARLTDLARRSSFWVARDPRLADELVELSASNMVVGTLLGHASFPAEFASRIVLRMAVPNGPDTNVDHDRYAASLSAALASLADDPGACLDLLLDRPTAYALASWRSIDTSALAEFVVSGLYDAVAADPTRLADGYQVIELLTRATNGPLDGGMSAGMALGVATSMAGYVDTLAPAIRQEGPTPVVVRAIEPTLELGTYDDVVDLFGALLRVPEAQVALGTVLGAYTFETVERVGADATRRPDLQYVARFADLIGDADRAERAELVMIAAAEEARRRQLGSLIGFGTSFTLLALHAPSTVRSIVGQAVKVATDRMAQVEPATLPDARIPAGTYDLVTVAAVATMAANPAARTAARLDDVTEEQWDEARRHVAAIEASDDLRGRSLAVGDLDHWIETSVPALAAYLVQVRSIPGMEELTETRAAVEPD